jgi:hypothetical protein
MSDVSTPRAVTVAIPTGGLVVAIGEDAEPVSSLTSSHVHFDVCPTWLELAIRHLSDAQVAQGARIETWRDADENSKTGALKWEFEASIQAIVASGIAVDAFYAVVQSRVHLPQSLIDEWRQAHSALHSDLGGPPQGIFVRAKECEQLASESGRNLHVPRFGHRSFRKDGRSNFAS